MNFGLGVGKNLVGFTSFNQNVVDTVKNETASSQGSSWWPDVWGQVNTTINKAITTIQEHQKNQGQTPTVLPQWFPPYYTQSDLPYGGIVSGPGDQPISLHLPEEKMNWTPIMLGAGLAVLLFVWKK